MFYLRNRHKMGKIESANVFDAIRNVCLGLFQHELTCDMNEIGILHKKKSIPKRFSRSFALCTDPLYICAPFVCALTWYFLSKQIFLF